MNIQVVNKLKKNMDLHIFVVYQKQQFTDKLKKVGFDNKYNKLSEDFTGRYNQILKLYTKNSRIMLVGVGDKTKLTKIKLRKCLSNISSMINKQKLNNIMLHPLDDFIDVQVEAISMNNYSFNKYKTMKNNK